MVKKIIAFFIFATSLFIFADNLLAYGCDSSDKIQYKKEAQNVSYVYIPRKTNGKVMFDLKISGLTSTINFRKITGKLPGEYIEYKYGTTGSEYTIYDILEGTTLKFEIHPEDEYCTDLNLRTINITFPYYNKFYSDKRCEGNESFVLCQRWLNYMITEEKFDVEISKYLTEKNQNGSGETIVNEYYFGVFDFILKYAYWFAAALLIFLIFLIIKIKKQKKQSFE